MEHQRDRQAEKRRDLARSTCSPLGSVARAARAAKRNANRRERRAQKAALITVRKAPCLCDEDVDHCPRCDQEMSHFHLKKSRPKMHPWHYYQWCHEYRQAWDKFSQIYRWADARFAKLSRAEFLREVQSLGGRVAHAHAIFHLKLNYDYLSLESEKYASPKMTVAALTSALRERGVGYCDHPERLLTTIAERICTHGKFDAANQWSFELCHGLDVDADGVRHREVWWNSVKLHLRHLDSWWWMDLDNNIGYRPLWGIEDAAAWAAEIQRLFDVFWGPRFLNTPEGRWVIGELVTTAIPKRVENPTGVVA